MNCLRTILYGIDSLDREIVHNHLDRLPNFARLLREGASVDAVSTLPPDSATAWATIYTGLEPAHHGILFFKDPLDKVNHTVCENIDNSILERNTFWDVMGDHGKRVCLFLPHMGFPTWKVNGVMIARSVTDVEFDVYPPGTHTHLPLHGVAGFREIPSRAKSRRTEELIENARRQITTETDCILNLMDEEKWDLMFGYSSILDWIEHNFWMYWDTNDPSYPGPNRFDGLIPEFYEIYDRQIGRLLDKMLDDQVLIVLSDHGHGMRPQRLLNVNVALSQHGFLTETGDEAALHKSTGAIESAKRGAAYFVNRYGFGNLAMKALHALPGLRKIYTSPPTIDWQNTTAFVSDLSGIKAYNYGGVVINKSALGDRSYPDSVNQIMAILRSIEDPLTKRRAVKGIWRREELSEGPFTGKYPDILFLLDKELGAGWATHGPLFGRSHIHNIQPGSHRLDTPVVIAYSRNGIKAEKPCMQLRDVAPSILQLAGVEIPHTMKGSPIFKTMIRE